MFRALVLNSVRVCKMYVIVYMLLTEAAVALAAGTVAEFQLRIVRICLAADAALVVIKPCLLFTLDAPRLLAEVDGVCAGPLGHAAEKVTPAEDEKVDDRNHGQKIDGEGILDNAQQEEESVHIGQILHLDGQNEKQQHLHIREKGRKGEEHGKVDVLGAEHKVYAGDKVHDHTVDDGQYNAGEEIDVELRSAPVLFKGAAYPIVKIEGNEGQHTRTGRVEYK